MAKKKLRSWRGGKNSKRLLGKFSLPDLKEAVGELHLHGRRTNLCLHSEEFLPPISDGSCIVGQTYDGTSVTLVDCMSPGWGSTYRGEGFVRYHADVFPHYVVTGEVHLDPAKDSVTQINFSTPDLATIFYDFDAFGHVIDSRQVIDAVVEEQRRTRSVETGDWPAVYYFTGKTELVEVDTVIGRISISHSPTRSSGGPSGFWMRNRIVVSIEPPSAVSFKSSIERLRDVCGFMSLVAGRMQEVDRVDIRANPLVDDVPQFLRVRESFHWKNGSESSRQPHPGDLPLDPIRRREEFQDVMKNWLARHECWGVARNRYLGCLRKGNKYDVDRLVAAANMFDILPAGAFPSVMPLDFALSETRDRCSNLLRQHARSPDRDSALSALGRMGQWSLPKKVAHRVGLVDARFEGRFPDLQFVANTAVRARNFYVHGSAGGLNFSQVEPLMPFLTDALEFIFAASDLIDAGWDATRFAAEPMGWGHTFGQFKSKYDVGLAELRSATENQAS